MKETDVKQNILIPFTLIGASIIGIYFGLLEPSIRELVSLNTRKNDVEVKLVDLKKNYNEEPGSLIKNTGNKNIAYLLDYLEALILKSDINKLKSYQPVGIQGAKGIPAYQIRFTANANDLLKFMYLSEETLPRLAISSCRASSIVGGLYGGMRQLECLLTVSLIAKGNETKINIAGLNKFKSIYRDPFSETPEAEPVKEKIKEPEEVREVEKWTLTAVMSDGEADTLLFKKESGEEKHAVTLRKTGQISLVWGKDRVEIKIGEEKILWLMGETKAEDTLPKEFVESIKNGESGKDAVEKTPEALRSGGIPSEEEFNTRGIPEESLKITEEQEKIQDRINRIPRRR
ncbi:MAG: hypothetical protein V1752_00020 [Candidatus Firestonebacteria bacterium]